MAFYLRRPHSELVRGRCPVGFPGDDECTGFVMDAELIKPSKPEPTPTPAPAPAPAKPKPKPKPPHRTSSVASSASASSGQLAPSQSSSKLPKAGSKSCDAGSSVDRPTAAAPAAQQAQQGVVPGVLRDRLGRRLERPGEGAAAEGRAKKARKPLQFPGGMRPEELTLCRLWEAQGACEVPNCVFAHGEVCWGPARSRRCCCVRAPCAPARLCCFRCEVPGVTPNFLMVLSGLWP
jgi:hypothetical protein